MTRKQRFAEIFGERPIFVDKINEGLSAKFSSQSELTLEKALILLSKSGYDGEVRWIGPLSASRMSCKGYVRVQIRGI